MSHLSISPALAKDEGVEEPPDYKMEDYRSPTPATLNGAKVVTVQQARELWHSQGAVFIDVMPRAQRPPDLPADIIWRDQTRETIPGAVWLPNVGYARLPPDVEAYFKRSLEELTGGDKAKPILFFCMADCWMSWNAAKRAREEYGYTDVIWFPQGVDGWGFPDAPLVKLEPRPLAEPAKPQPAPEQPQPPAAPEQLPSEPKAEQPQASPAPEQTQK